MSIVGFGVLPDPLEGCELSRTVHQTLYSTPNNTNMEKPTRSVLPTPAEPYQRFEQGLCSEVDAIRITLWLPQEDKGCLLLDLRSVCSCV